ncbi:MAG TPA: lysophospholipid acyltransferase family protein [Burkholderiales bacterium]|nr:lysophospholipid acyltransferase family protein [Burkholderiales bacterium]
MPRFPRILLGVLANLPLGLAHRLGTVLGWAMYGISPTYRRNLRANLERAGYRDPRVRRAAIAHAGQLLAETPAMWLRPQERVAALVREVHGMAAVDAARAAGRALLFLTPHMGCFEITAQYAGQRMPMTVLYRPPKLAWLEPLMRAGRGRGGVRLVPADARGVREVLAALKRREAAGFLPDQVPGEGEGEWAEFFGELAYTATLAPRLAQRAEVACVLAYAERLPRGAGYRIVLKTLPPPRPGETPVRHLNRALEDLVRECPGQYLWGYNRYKTPRGAKPRPTIDAGGEIPPAPPA